MLKSISASCFLAAALAAMPVVSAAASVDFETLKDFELKAADAADQAAQLDTSTRSPQLGWESYSIRLQALKDDINDMGRLLALLEERRDSLAPFDREVIDRAAPLLHELADNTTAAVRYANENQRNFWTPANRKYIDSLVSESSRLSTSLTHAVDLDKARAKERRLEKLFEAGQ